MLDHLIISSRLRGTCLAGASGLAILTAPTSAVAQNADEGVNRIDEIVVTAQRREQSLLDVPIAVTALGDEALTQARVTSIMDLSAVVPNLTIVPTAGGINAPTFAMRGKLSQGTNPGQDKAIGIYIDGVPFGSPYGASFDLPDIERLEVLRGPQGTLFGRNSTAGAISVVTRDPDGQFGVKQVVTMGNYDQLRTVTTVDTPQWGPFSAYVSYIHSERDGDIRNLGAGTVWDLSNAETGWKLVSPKTLGAHNSENIFAAVKFQPSDRFKLDYRYNRVRRNFTAEGYGLVWETVSTGATSALKTAMLADPPLIAGKKRPKVANNAFNGPGYLHADFHSAVATFDVNDEISIKNIFGHQKVDVFSFTTLSGVGPSQGGVYKNAAGDWLVPVGTIAGQQTKNWSDELQLTYNSKFVTVTAGGIVFKSDAFQGPPRVPGSNPVRTLPRTPFGAVYPNGLVAVTGPTDYFDDGKSLAAYFQGEFHVLPNLDIVAGYRITDDKKTGVSTVTSGGVTNTFAVNYKDTRSTYMGGVNFKPNDDILVYAKYSTGFVSGGAMAGYPYRPETVKSWEAGVKAGLFDRRLQVNLALFSADYKNHQTTAFGSSLAPPQPQLGSIVITGGNVKAKGFELETTAVPLPGLALTANLGYTDQHIYDQDPFRLVCTGACVNFVQNWVSKWTAQLSARYETDPLFGDARLMFRVDGNYRSEMSLEARRLADGSTLQPRISASGLAESPAGWVVNARVALKDIALAGGNAEIALWSRNLFNNDRPGMAINFGPFFSAPYEAARTYGVDLTFKY